MLALVLDDDEMNNLLMIAALQPLAGCTPRDFTLPVEALAFAEAHAAEIGIVVTDYEMPGMNGIDFIRAVRRIPDLANVPTVMVTSFNERSLRREALEAGATDFPWETRGPVRDPGSRHKPPHTISCPPRAAAARGTARARSRRSCGAG